MPVSQSSRLSKLPEGFRIDGTGYRKDYEWGFLRFIPAADTDPKDKGWVGVREETNGHKHAIYFASFKQAAEHLNG